MKLIIASNNKGKIAEFSQMLSPLGYEVLSQKDAGISLDVDETGTTFEENAALKAEAVAKLAKDCAVLADDSGLEIDALGGEPGVYSARYGGEEYKTPEDRNNLVLKKLEGVPEQLRTARFVAVLCFVSADGKKISVRGECEGRIAFESVGDAGFGYDPIFVYGDRTFGQHSQILKNCVSHRARALAKLTDILKKEKL